MQDLGVLIYELKLVKSNLELLHRTETEDRFVTKKILENQVNQLSEIIIDLENKLLNEV